MTTNLAAMIDAYATLKTEQGALEQRKKELEKAFAELKPGAYESENYRLSISDSNRESPDKELAEEIKKVVDAYRETLTRQYLCAHTNKTLVRTHRIGLPTGKDLVA